MAGATFRGDFAKLNKLANQLELLGSARFRRQALLSVSEEAMTLVQEGFTRESDPTGIAWLRSRRAEEESGLTLTDTARLRNSIRRRMDATSFTLATNVKYAAIHNYGGNIRIARHTSLQLYRVTKGGKRTRVSLYGGSKSKRLVRKGVDVKAHSIKMPRRQFLPYGGRALPYRYRKAFTSALNELRDETLGAR